MPALKPPSRLLRVLALAAGVVCGAAGGGQAAEAAATPVPTPAAVSAGPGSATAANPAAPGADAALAIYQVGPGDVLGIEVYDNPDLTGTFVVNPEGGIVYPLLGPVPVKGQTAEQVKANLTRLLEKDYLYAPIVSVTIREFRSKQVTILGDVGRPGVYYLERPTKLLELLSRADGATPQLGRIVRGQNARVVRPSPGGGAPSTVKVDLYQLLVEGREDQNLLLAEGDVIYLERTPQVHVVGEVKRPGSFPYEGGITVLKAITLAGGVTTKAGKTPVVKRIQEGKEVEVKVKMETVLEPEDIVEVPLSFW